MIWRYPAGPRPSEYACSCHLHLAFNDDREREGKRRTLPRLRLDPDLAAVHLDDALGYGKPQAGAALLAGDGIVCLAETPGTAWPDRQWRCRVQCPVPIHGMSRCSLRP